MMDAEEWRDSTLNTSSWWEIPSRTKEDGHRNVLHGNYVPQIPAEMIARFTQPGDLVADPFMGSGTTAIECIRQGRSFIGFELNEDTHAETYEHVHSLEGDRIKPFRLIHQDCLSVEAYETLKQSVARYDKKIALTMLHPPYLDIIRFNLDEPRCLSSMDLNTTLTAMTYLAAVFAELSTPDGHLALVIGDVWDKKHSRLIPLGSMMLGCIGPKGWDLRATIVKNVTGTRVQQKNKNLWRYRCLKNGTYTFEHEYIHLFKRRKVT